MINVTDGMVVYPKVIEQRVMQEIPFMASENIMMAAVKKGGDRQELHEKIREYSMLATHQVNVEVKQNDLLDRICADESFGLNRQEIDEILVPSSYIGCCKQQVEDFLKNEITPYLSDFKPIDATISV